MGLINRQKFKLPNEKVKMVWSSGKSPLIFCVCQIAVALGVWHTHTRPAYLACVWSFLFFDKWPRSSDVYFELPLVVETFAHESRRPEANRRPHDLGSATHYPLPAFWRLPGFVKWYQHNEKWSTIADNWITISREMSRANTTNMSGIFLPIWLKYKPFDSSLKALQLCFWA